MPQIIPASQIKTISDYDVTTTVNVLHSGWRHALSYESMIENDLMIVPEPQARVTISGVFGGVSTALVEP